MPDPADWLHSHLHQRWTEVVFLCLERSFWPLAIPRRCPETGVGNLLLFLVCPAEEDPPSPSLGAGGTPHVVRRVGISKGWIAGFGIIRKDQHRLHRAPKPHPEAGCLVLDSSDVGDGSIHPRVRSLLGLVASLLPFRQISRESQGEAVPAPGAQRQADSQAIPQTDTRHGSRVHPAPVDGVRIALFSTPLNEAGKEIQSGGKNRKKNPDRVDITGWTAKPLIFRLFWVSRGGSELSTIDKASTCLFVRGLWGGCRTASQPLNHAFTSFGTIANGGNQVMVESVCSKKDIVEECGMNKAISHDRNEETQEAKARWFQSLSLTERADLLCQFTDMILSANPNIVEQKDAQSIKGRILVLTET